MPIFKDHILSSTSDKTAKQSLPSEQVIFLCKEYTPLDYSNTINMPPAPDDANISSNTRKAKHATSTDMFTEPTIEIIRGLLKRIAKLLEQLNVLVLQKDLHDTEIAKIINRLCTLQTTYEKFLSCKEYERCVKLTINQISD